MASKPRNAERQEVRSLLPKSPTASTLPEEFVPLARLKHISLPPAARFYMEGNKYAKLDSSRHSSHVHPQREKEELQKVIYRSSWPLILLQCSIHLIPIGACIVLFTFNFMGLFIGSQLSGPVSISDDIKLDLLQFIAKAHEIFIISSLGIIVFDTIRHQLLFGGGIPLGLVGSGFSFSQPGFFLSSEFWKSVNYRSSTFKKFVLLSVIGLAGLIAATAGPSSAILMIPQNHTWPSGNIKFYLNGSLEQLWPTSLTAADVGGSNCLTSNASANSRCAAGGYKNLYSYFSQLMSLPPSSYFTFDTMDDVSMRTIQGNLRNDWQVSSETWAATAHVATTAIEEPLRQAWTESLPYIKIGLNAWRYQYSNFRTVQVKTQFPMVRTVCIPTMNLSSGTSTLPFPVLSEFDYWYSHPITNNGQGTYGNGPVYPISVQPAFDLFTSTAKNGTAWYKNIALSWIEPSPEVGSASGAVLVLFASPETELIMGLSCTLDARWADGTGWITAATSAWGGPNYLQPMQIYPSHSRSPGFESRLFVPKNNSAWQRIDINSDFFAAMALATNDTTNSSNSIVMTLQDSIPHLINTAYPDRYFSNHTSTFVPFVEQVLATFFVDSIARTGSYLQRTSTETLLGLKSNPHSTTGIQGPALDLIPSTAESPTTVMTMQTSIQGYSYLISGFTTYLAIIILMLYSTLALGHTAWILREGCVSDAWKTISQVILLAQNSQPVPDLCGKEGVGGIGKEALVMKGKIVKVENEERLVFRWGREGEEGALTKRLVIDRCYG